METYLRPSDELNVLVVHFKSALKAAKALEAQYGKVRAGSANLGDPSRVYLRKAQYDWRYVLICATPSTRPVLNDIQVGLGRRAHDLWAVQTHHVNHVPLQDC